MPNEAERVQARVFLVDDHALVREHLTALIEAEPDLGVCGTAEDAPTALALIRQSEPDLVILDISLKRSNGLDLLKDLKKLQPQPAVLILSMHEATFFVEQALQAGALGYITKEDATTNILRAIRRVLRGQVYLSDRMAGQMREHLSAFVEVASDRAVGVQV
jgi:DNA-binding NarL/FixJ family response regulator